MLKFFKRLFGKQKVEENPQPKKDSLKRKLQKERIQRRKAMRRNKAERRKYRESHGKWVVPKTSKKHRV